MPSHDFLMGYGAAKADTIADIVAAGEEQIQAIEDKGEEVRDSLPSDYTELTDEVSDLKSSVEQLDEKGLSALGAEDGQIPTADGDGGWEWETPNFIRATDSQGQPIVIPEVNDSTTSANDVWSSQKTSTEIAAKYTKPAGGIPTSDLEFDPVEIDDSSTSTDGVWSSSKVNTELNTKQDALTAGNGIQIIQNVISVRDRQIVHRQVTLTEDVKRFTVHFGAKIQEVYLNSELINGFDKDYSMYFRIIDAQENVLCFQWTSRIVNTADTNACSCVRFIMNNYGIGSFMSTGRSSPGDINGYATAWIPTCFAVIDPTKPEGVQLQLSNLGESTILFKAGSVFDFYAVLQDGESV